MLHDTFFCFLKERLVLEDDLVCLEKKRLQKRVHEIGASENSQENQQSALETVVERNRTENKIGQKTEDFKDRKEQPKCKPLLIVLGVNGLYGPEAFDASEHHQERVHDGKDKSAAEHNRDKERTHHFRTL